MARVSTVASTAIRMAGHSNADHLAVRRDRSPPSRTDDDLPKIDYHPGTGTPRARGPGRRDDATGIGPDGPPARRQLPRLVGTTDRGGLDRLHGPTDRPGPPSPR